MSSFGRICAQIDLDAWEYNIAEMKSKITSDAKIIAVVKANGYGHGAVTLSREAQHLDFLWGFAVATADEAFILREAGIKKPILVLGYTFKEDYARMIEEDIRPVVFTASMARDFSEEAVRLNKEVYFHIKIDTGMGRIGYIPGDEAIKDIKMTASLPHVKMEGIFTHFARADEKDKTSAKRQSRLFLDFISKLESEGVSFSYHHCCNSAGIMELYQGETKLVRGGISLYGLWPSNEMDETMTTLKPVLTWKSTIVHIKDVPPGTPVSYGGTWTATKTTRVATISAGYGDGYPRSLSNKGYVLIHGKKAAILGRVCMDQFMVDVTEIPEAALLDEVVLLGKSENLEITGEELGNLSGRFNYELVCDINERVPRIYYRHGIKVQ